MERIISDFPQFRFIADTFFMYCPSDQSVTYDVDRVNSNNGLLALVHEVSHGVLEHRVYKYDLQLVQMEIDAWEMTRKLAERYGLEVDEEHIANCIDSYDYWATKRATCPDCDNFSLQRGRDEYSCFNCGAIWQVNWRKDRRVTRKVVERYRSPAATGLAQFAERPEH